jgi:HPr kinase/phosphorylase
VGGGAGRSERRFDEVAVRAARSGADLVGYLNYIHPYRVQILGEREVAYLTNATAEDCARRIARIVTLEPPVLVLTDGQRRPDALLSMCERAQIPMFATHEPSAFVIDVLRAYLSKHFAERTSMHGVFMDILGLGVLITGESGLGKSELGLELITRGNGLVADDAVDLYRVNQTTIEGRCPELLQNLLEVRGIGLLDIRAIFGETAVRRKMRLRLIVHLVRRETMEARVRAAAVRAAHPGRAGRAGAQGRDPGGRRPQHGRAGRGRRAQHHPAAAGRGHLPGVVERHRRAMEKGG